MINEAVYIYGGEGWYYLRQNEIREVVKFVAPPHLSAENNAPKWGSCRTKF